MIRERMGKLLMESGLISEDQLQAALQAQQQDGRRLGGILVDMGAISESSLLHFLGQQYGVPVLPHFPDDPDPDLAGVIPGDLATRFLVVPTRRLGNRLTLAMADPSNVGLIDDLAFKTGHHIVPAVALSSEILKGIALLYGNSVHAPTGFFDPSNPSETHQGDGSSQGSSNPSILHGGEQPSSVGRSFLDPNDFQTLLDEASISLSGNEPTFGEDSVIEEPAPIVRLVDNMLQPAADMGVSDVHLEPYESCVRVRYRLDGVLHSVMSFPLKLRNAVISRLKILSNLNIAERRLPQDGRMTFKNGREGGIDVRVSILPCFHGEKAVLRLLDRSDLDLDLSLLGFEESELASFLAALEKPDGLVLVTGPTGSGKTTTLYSALKILNTPGVNIVTVEDPVEYHFTGMNQVQVREEIGLTFGAVLRAVLRQDPDILMVGEIRDQETARIAVKAALTGHRVLSTVHTQDAVRTLSRLLDMGVEPFMVASSLTLVLTQRLVRRICTDCREPVPLQDEQLVRLGLRELEAERLVAMKGRGCASCYGTGYKGRVALFEVLPVSETIRSMILRHASPDDLKHAALESGLTTLRQNGLAKVRAGVTTLEEVVSVTSPDLPPAGR